MSEAADREEIRQIVDEVLRDGDLVFPVGYDLEELIDIESLVTSEGGITDPLGQLAQFITDLANSLTAWLAEAVPAAVKGFIDWLWSMIEPAVNAVKKLVEDAWKALESAIAGIPDAVKGFIDWLWEQIQEALEGVTGVLDEVRKRLEDLGATFQGFVNAILRFPEWFPAWFEENIAKPISDAIAGLAGKLMEIADAVEKGLKGLPDAISGLAAAIWEALPDWLKDALEGLASALDEIRKGIEDFLRDPLGWIQNNVIKPLSDALAEFSKWIWEHLPEPIKNAIIGIQEAWSRFVEGLTDFLENPVGFIQARLREFADWIWSMLPDWLKGAIETVKKWFESLWAGLQEFLADPAKWIQDRLTWLAEQIWALLPDWLKEAIETLQEFFQWLYESLTSAWEALQGLWQEFWADPLKFIQERIARPLINAAMWLWNLVSSTVQTALETLMSWFNAVAKTVADLGKAIVSGLANLSVAVFDALKGVAETVAGGIAKIFKTFIEGLIAPIKEYIQSLIKKIHGVEEGGAGGEVEAIFALGVAMLPSYLAVLFLPRLLKTISHLLKEARGRLEGSLEPLGIGGKVIINIVTSFTKAFYEIGDAIEDLPKKMAGYFVQGFSIWGLEPLRYPFRYFWRQYLEQLGLGWVPFELPPMGELKDMARRFGVEEMKDDVELILRYRGYPNWYIENFVKLPEEAKLEIEDRFGTPRTVPLGMLYVQPSVSDLARFMIRDIFGVGTEALASFSDWAARIGLYKDVALLYYLLHFKYPSPERLWEFASRGIAGLLWFTPTQDEASEASEHAKAIGAKVPVAPAELNFEAGKIFYALMSYMKWHDYANFAWIDGFTSDNWIVIDTLADIPTKIDIRWMTKWGLFDFMASKEIKIETPASGFINVVENQIANKKVYMDLSLMCRLLQATGLHPYYVPIVSVAETINAVMDERTFLRTGIVDLYRWGATDYSTLDELMAELVVASFKVAYFDIAERKWKDGYVNIPVMYLPAERKLLELRAALDRYTRVWREMLSDIERGYREYIIGAEDAKKYLEGLAKTINERFAAESEEIAGRKLEYALDEKFIDSILSAWEPARVVYTYRRIRYWFYRVLGWLIYRLAFGYVKKEDIERITEVFAQAARLAPEEKEAIMEIAEAVVGVVVKEYIPTPSQLATIAEVVPSAARLAPKVFEERGVPGEWRPVWAQYIETKPLIDEIKRYITAVITAYARGVLSEEEWKDAMSLPRKYGWTDREISILKAVADLRKKYYDMREIAREYIPTPSMLATMSEVVPEARMLMTKVFDARNVPAEWRPIWAKYIQIKPIVDEVRAVLTSARRLYEYFMIDAEMFAAFLEVLKPYGWEDAELALLLDRANLDRWHRAYRELVGTPRELVTMAEYSPMARRLALAEVKKRIDALPIGDEEKEFLYKMWEEYIRIKPVYDEVEREITELISDYAKGLITWDQFVTLLEELKGWGIDEWEIDAYKFIAFMRRRRYELAGYLEAE